MERERRVVRVLKRVTEGIKRENEGDTQNEKMMYDKVVQRDFSEVLYFTSKRDIRPDTNIAKVILVAKF